MPAIRSVAQIRKSRLTTEGAGVRLRRVFGEVDARLDPFLLLDHFGSDRPEDYLAGFPSHPHRGIETITYMLDGTVEHGDSLGNAGSIGPGDVQWMTAGSGIIHQEMPRRSKALEGFQLWSNLPASDKMMHPRYRDVLASDIPGVDLGPGAHAKVICGSIAGVQGSVQDIVTDPLYLDVSLEPGKKLDLEISAEHNAFVYLFRGSMTLGPGAGKPIPLEHLAVLSGTGRIHGQADVDGARLVLVAGRPIGEPVAWGGPIVMNTHEELQQAFREYQSGSFLRHAS